MRASQWIAIAGAALALSMAGCAGKPVYDVTSAPIAASKANPSMDDIGKAIQRAGAGLGWQMQQVRPGQIVGTLALRDHKAVVDVTYDPKTYSIKYKDSTNLNYDGSTIHNNYNGWIQNLDKAIRTQLSLL
jgi:hypothetical protein